MRNKKSSKKHFKITMPSAEPRLKRLALHSAITLAMLGGSYGRSAYAASSCDPAVGPISCAGDAALSFQGIGGLQVIIDPNFSGLATQSGNAFTLSNSGITGSGLSFLDEHAMTISGASRAIEAYNSGDGALTITTTGVVTGQSDSGIQAINSSNGKSLTIEALDSVTGGANGIYARNFGTGALNITTSGAVTGQSDHGIYANNSSNGKSLTIEASESVTGNTVGIYALNNGSGALSITTSGAVEGQSHEGIYAENLGNGTSLTIEASESVTGNTVGIYALNNGTGALSITTSGAVTGEAGTGILAFNSQNGISLTIEALASVTGYEFGIYASNYSTGGALSITTSGAVTGETEAGIRARNSEDGTSLTIEASESVTGNTVGIYAQNIGTGALSITTSGAVTGETEAGISAVNSRDGTSLTIEALASVTGYEFGIHAQNNGTGTLSITTSGAVTGQSDHGIYANNSSNGTSLTIKALASVTGNTTGIDTEIPDFVVGGEDGSYANKTASVTGNTRGISAHNNGTGALSITTSGAVTGEEGIYARNVGTDLEIVASESVTGNSSGISAQNMGTGALSITTSGAVTGQSEGGIQAFNSSNGTSLTIEALDSVTGYEFGIDALNISAGGALSITTSGAVEGQTLDGITAINGLPSGIEVYAVSTDLTINASAVTGGVNGIAATNKGSGALSITTSGAVTGQSDNGIYAKNSSDGTSLTIEALDSVTGSANGIYARNFGTGALNITTSGTVEGQTLDGITAIHGLPSDIEVYAVSTDLTINASAVTGVGYGIAAINNGTGALSITTSGAVEGQSGFGIYTRNFGADLEIIATESVTGNSSGIGAVNVGTGALSITTSGAVTGAEAGITAVNWRDGTSLTIEASESVTGNTVGIYALNNGTGALSITTSGAVTGETEAGIRARNSEDGTSLTIEALDSVTGSANGIYARNYGTGALNITTSGTVEGQTLDGITAIHGLPSGIEVYAVSTDLTINASAVTGVGHGIAAINNGTGALSITTSGAVEGQSGFGIYARNVGTDLEIVASESVTGNAVGIGAANVGTGALSITTSGAVTGAEAGIVAFNGRDGTSLTIEASESVTGNTVGIYAENIGTGALSITTSGAVTGETEAGISAVNSSDGTSLTIEASESVTGGANGIYALNNGTGALSITTSGAVTGQSDNGIYAKNSSDGTSLTIASESVTGGANGIYARNFGTGALNITTSGAVAGQYGMGIYSKNLGTDINLTINHVTATNGAVSINHQGTGVVNSVNTGTLTTDSGSVIMIEGSIAGGSIINNGSWISGDSAALLLGEEFSSEEFSSNVTFENNGTIIGGDSVAIDITAVTGSFTFNQNAGVIDGDINLGIGDTQFTIKGGTISGTIRGQGSGVVTVDVGTGNTFDANVIDNVEEYIIQSGTVNQLGNFGTADNTTTIAPGASMALAGVINGSGGFILEGDLELGADAMLDLSGQVSFGADSTLTIASGGTVTLNQPRILLSADGITDNGIEAIFNIGHNLLYSSATSVVNNDYQMTTTVNDLGALSSSFNQIQFGTAATAYVEAGGTGMMVDMLAALDIGDIEGFESVAEQLSPSVSGAVLRGSLAASDATGRLINQRIIGTHETDHEKPSGVWVHTYHSSAEQDKQDYVAGFDSQVRGSAIGFDRVLGQWQVGISYSATDVDIDNDRDMYDQIESNQIMLYGAFRQDNWFAAASIGGASLQYDFKKRALIDVQGETDGDILAVDIGLGKHFIVNEMTVTPTIGIRYASLEVDAYTEVGGLNQQIEYAKSDILTSKLGLTAAGEYDMDNWTLIPSVSLAWTHELGDDLESLTASYAGQSYTQRGTMMDSDMVVLGAGVKMVNANGVQVTLDLDGKKGSSYSSQQVSLGLRYEF